MSKQSDSIFLQIYDIIKINSPSNDLYHDKQFLIEYIDNIKLKIINVTSNDEYTLLLNPDKSLQDESIESITLISRDTNDGYAKQNNLLPNTWINIHFGGEFPSIVTGQITNFALEQSLPLRTGNFERQEQLGLGMGSGSGGCAGDALPRGALCVLDVQTRSRAVL